MFRRELALHWKIVLGAVSICVLIACYSYMSHRQKQINPDDKTIPSWSELWDGTAKSFEVNPRANERWVVVDSAATLKRLALGMFYGVAGSLLLGFLMGLVPAVEAFLFPPLSLLAKIPATGMMAVFFVLVGTDTKMFVSMIAFGVLPTLTQTVYLGVREVPDELRYKAYTLGASHMEVIWNVVFRHVLPKLLDSIRLQIGPAMVFLIAAEWIAADQGFGYRIRLEQKKLNMAVVYPYLAMLAAFGFALDYLMRWVRSTCSPWYEGRGA